MRLERQGAKYAEKAHKSATAEELNRSLKLRQMPKLALATAGGCDLILAAQSHIGSGSDQPDFQPLLYRAWKRAKVRLRSVVADAGYDSENNHRIARLDLAVRSVIPPKIGRPSDKAATGHFRRLMQQRFARRADRRLYGQRAQTER
jgi:hypothetical protein